MFSTPHALTERPAMTHTKRCIARSLICAVENVRDEEGVTDSAFLERARLEEFLIIAEDYLSSGLLNCVCS